MKTPDQPEKPGRIESSYRMDPEVAIDILKEIIIDEGKVVFEAFWDSGGPGAGADSEYVFKYRDLYWPGSSVYGVYGPFNSLEESLSEVVAAVGSATSRVDCMEMSAEELVSHIFNIGMDEGQVILINGEEWTAGEDGKLRRVGQPEST